MGTRGLMAFAQGDRLIGQYNQFDTYPSGLGRVLVAWARKADFDDAAAKFASIVPVKEQDEPTDEQRAALADFGDTGVSTGRDWYSALRECQGDPEATLASGFITDNTEFAKDSLFCEWAYVVDLDNRTVEIYEGFQQAPPKHGRWATVKPGTDILPHGGDAYYPVELRAIYHPDSDTLELVGDGELGEIKEVL